MLTPNTLTFRLVVTSTLWVAATLLIAGLLLVGLFRAHIERRFDLLLQDDFEELVAASEVGSDGKLMLGWAPADPRFHRPRSGWYWQILRDGEAVAQSESLWLSRLDLSAPPIETGAVIQELEGPGGHQLRAFAETATLPQAKSVFGYVVAGKERGITLAAEHLDSVAFRGDRHDLEEMLGNLMDNACKWAHHQIWVSAARINGHLRIKVEDDGPGVPEERLTEICKRGQGLDEATHGSGLGLSIVQELAGLYDGGLSLGKSKLGGLCAELDLPACE